MSQQEDSPPHTIRTQPDQLAQVPTTFCPRPQSFNKAHGQGLSWLCLPPRMVPSASVWDAAVQEAPNLVPVWGCCALIPDRHSVPSKSWALSPEDRCRSKTFCVVESTSSSLPRKLKRSLCSPLADPVHAGLERRGALGSSKVKFVSLCFAPGDRADLRA